MWNTLGCEVAFGCNLFLFFVQLNFMQLVTIDRIGRWACLWLFGRFSSHTTTFFFWEITCKIIWDSSRLTFDWEWFGQPLKQTFQMVVQTTHIICCFVLVGCVRSLFTFFDKNKWSVQMVKLSNHRTFNSSSFQIWQFVCRWMCVWDVRFVRRYETANIARYIFFFAGTSWRSFAVCSHDTWLNCLLDYRLKDKHLGKVNKPKNTYCQHPADSHPTQTKTTQRMRRWKPRFERRAKRFKKKIYI